MVCRALGPVALLLAALTAAMPASPALAWGFEGHQVIALMARPMLKPEVLAQVDAILAADADPLTGHDMASEATWADRYRGAGHKETGDWHFVDTELDHPDLKSACFGFPSSGPVASKGPAEDCVVDKIEAFARELRDPATPAPERLLALKYLLHFVGDVHQPLHAADNHDRGGNCVPLALGGPRTVNLHAFWDTAVVEALDKDASALAARLGADITARQRSDWSAGDAKAWALESYAVAQGRVYILGSKPGCERDVAPVALPAGYLDHAKRAAAPQLQKAAVRLAMVLNGALGA